MKVGESLSFCSGTPNPVHETAIWAGEETLPGMIRSPGRVDYAHSMYMLRQVILVARTDSI